MNYEPVSIGKLGIRLRSDVFGRQLNSDNTKNKVIHKDTLTIGMGSKTIDYSILHQDINYSVSPDYKTFKINNSVNTYYWDMYFKVSANRFFYLYAKENTRNGRRIDIDSLLKHKININIHNSEIGHFLSQIDKLIQNNKKRINIYNSNKKTILKFYFSDENLKYYQYTALYKLCTSMRSGGTPKSTNNEFYNGTIPFMSISDIHNKRLNNTKKFITKNALLSSSCKVIPASNLIYTMYASPGIAFENNIDVAIPQSVISIELKKKENLIFIKEYLNYKQKKILKFAMTGTQSNLTGKLVKNINIPIFDKKTIQNLSSSLSQMDKLIEIEEKKLEKLNLMKKYYLQQFFD